MKENSRQETQFSFPYEKIEGYPKNTEERAVAIFKISYKKYFNEELEEFRFTNIPFLEKENMSVLQQYCQGHIGDNQIFEAAEAFWKDLKEKISLSRNPRIIFKKAFSGPRDPRSPEYKAGVLAALEYSCGEREKIENPYSPGTCQFDAYQAGIEEGNGLWEKESL